MLPSHLQTALAQHATRSLWRKRHLIAARQENHITVNNDTLINFSSNDYLCLAQHPFITQAYINGIHRYGMGSTAAPLICGYSQAHAELEIAFADFLKRDRALLFNSGYHANLGVLSTFANRHTTVIADKYCHASLIDGIVLSRAQHKRYQHNDMQQAETLLKQKTHPALLVSESVFSMQGDIADISQLAALAKRYSAMLLVDDAHGIGVLGKSGGGICEQQHLSQEDVPCLVLPLGKTFAGMGAIVSGSHDLIEALLQFSRTYRYSTALPPALCEATQTTLRVIQDETWRREKLNALIRLFVRAAQERALPLFSDALTPIKSIIIGNNEKTIAIQNNMIAHGFFVSCIREPTVPKNAACIRISLNCMHSEAHIIQLLDLLKRQIRNDD
ncbi:MAG TPA: 8-amino-7-oxononanoate synthase [Gammaproteobacteria bacterium]|jgi:8-amino-7-oxononanoate synthase|nr:8-amino-7-oxononanoate synthase [Gammaproteobacteria bacterium]